MTQPTTTELYPVDGRKSFYGKAKMIDDGKTAKLQSYDTIVAEYNHKTKKMTVHGWYSNTTARHIRSFFNYFGLPKATKQQLENWSNQ